MSFKYGLTVPKTNSGSTVPTASKSSVFGDDDDDDDGNAPLADR